MLLGYMTFLKKALKTLPDGLRAKIKATAGADPTPARMPLAGADAKPGATSAATPKTPPAGAKGAGSPSAAASRAVSAVTAVAGQLVGGIWGAGRAAAATGREEDEASAGGGRGLVRELVERCLFSLPHDRGSDVDIVSFGGGGDGDVLREGRTGDAEGDEVRGRLGCYVYS